MRFSERGKTDQSASQVDTRRPGIGAIDPLGLWETEKAGVGHGAVLDKVKWCEYLTWGDRYAFPNIRGQVL